jgi:hypothetical protein
VDALFWNAVNQIKKMDEEPERVPFTEIKQLFARGCGFGRDGYGVSIEICFDDFAEPIIHGIFVSSETHAYRVAEIGRNQQTGDVQIILRTRQRTMELVEQQEDDGDDDDVSVACKRSRCDEK